ncbi:MAG: hypothetical protein M1823_003210 [Watsoniomyces obsoletus]|nr:MAG: hypothetical protein M1823_003210 [Watsoniomyces obsoletus]
MVPALLLLFVSQVLAASWSFNDATVTVQAKGSGVGAGLKEKLVPSANLTKPIPLHPSDILKVTMTTIDGKTPKRPHQAFLVIQDVDTGLHPSYAMTVKESGKAKIEMTQNYFPAQFLSSSHPLKASIVIGSFGNVQPFKKDLFEIEIKTDANAPATVVKKPLRYGKLQEIYHTFRDMSKSPAAVITLTFVMANISLFLALLGSWWALGANVDHALGAVQRTFAHVSFCASILALEYCFYMYYLEWNLFQTLPVAAIAAVAAYLSGSRALTEVQERRLAGQR